MTTTPAVVSTVKPDRTIVLPDAIPIGAKIAVVVLPSEESQEDTDRAIRFQVVMDTIRNAINSDFEPPEISDTELNQLIDEARHAAQV
jgi:hypothetical protein